MILNLRISLLFVFFGYGFVISQNDNVSEPQKLKWLYDDTRQQIGSIAFSITIPTATGDNFIGQGFEGDDGYNFRMRLFVYKQLFIGYAFGSNNFDVIDRSVVGNYNSTKARDRFFYLGYEFLPLKKLRLGIHSSIGGRVTFHNSIENTPDNKDTGSLWNYGTYIDYEVLKNLSVFVDYSFNRVNTNIVSPVALQSTFDVGTYNTINFGIKFAFGDKALANVIGLKN